MARALSHDARVIVMDEPSAVLDAEEVENLFRVVRELTARGRRRRLHLAPARGDPPDRRPDHGPQGRPDRRDGPAGRETPTADLIRLMTGRNVEYVYPAAAARSPTTPRACSTSSGLGLAGAFSDVSFDVRAGEVVGLAGLVGSGRTEILETSSAPASATAGTVSVGGRRSCAPAP